MSLAIQTPFLQFILKSSDLRLEIISFSTGSHRKYNEWTHFTAIYYSFLNKDFIKSKFETDGIFVGKPNASMSMSYGTCHKMS